MLLLEERMPMSEADEAKIRISIDRAKIALMMQRKTTFFSALLANLKLLINTDRPTAATDAISLWMNPYFAAEQNEDQLLGLMLHEVMHVALDHCNFDVYKHLDQELIGIAMDHFINLYITSMGYVIPDGGYCDPKYRNKSTMEIYEELKKNPPPRSKNFQPDRLGKPDGMSDDTYKQKVESNIIKAAMQAEMANDHGSIPAHIRLKIKELISPELPWNLILYKYMDQYAKDDYSWSRPNKRWMPDFYLPCLRSEKMGGIVSGLDVSGSMTDDISECMAEMRYIKDLLTPEWFHLITFDTHVHHDHIYEESEHLPEEEVPDGGAGGTIIEPLIEAIVREEPRFALIFTDGYFSPPNMSQVKSDIYWIIKGNTGFRPPDGVGEVIHMN